MPSNLLEHSVENILTAVFDSSPSEIIVSNPSAVAFEGVVELASQRDEVPTIRLLGDEAVVKDVMDDFLVASNAADLLDDGDLAIRLIDGEPANPLIITPDAVVALVTIEETVAGLRSDDPAFVERANEHYRERWERADPYTLRTPPISRVRRTLADEIGEPVANDFDEVLASLQTARGDGNGLDEVTISLLVAAKNDVLLYDISKWGEDVGIASKATFSRTKTRLEDMGLIDTEKVPIDVGRPRLRLKFGDDRLRKADAEQLASVAQTLLN